MPAATAGSAGFNLGELSAPQRTRRGMVKIGPRRATPAVLPPGSIVFEGLHHFDHLFEASWFYQVRICAKPVSPLDILVVLRTGHDDHYHIRKWRLFPNPLQHIKPGGLWHFQVEKNQRRYRKLMAVSVRAFALDIAHRLGAVFDELNGIDDTDTPKREADQDHVVRIIVHEKDNRARLGFRHPPEVVTQWPQYRNQGKPESYQDFPYCAKANSSTIVLTNRTPFAAVAVALIGAPIPASLSTCFSFVAAKTAKSPRREPM